MVAQRISIYAPLSGIYAPCIQAFLNGLPKSVFLNTLLIQMVAPQVEEKLPFARLHLPGS
jgi:hypothetical protein